METQLTLLNPVKSEQQRDYKIKRKKHKKTKIQVALKKIYELITR